MTLRWSASHPEGLPLTYWVRYSYDGGKTWEPIAVDLTETELTVPLDELPGGKRCQFQVVAHDGFHSVHREFAAFELPERPPIATILEPTPEARLDSPYEILLRGEGYSPQEGSIRPQFLEWTSDRDGPLGSGRWLYVDELSPGRHRLTLTVTDAAGRRETQAISVVVPRPG